jgi:hypothetical protein
LGRVLDKGLVNIAEILSSSFEVLVSNRIH